MNMIENSLLSVPVVLIFLKRPPDFHSIMHDQGQTVKTGALRAVGFCHSVGTKEGSPSRGVE